jgi:hypothetical protein
MRNRIIGYLLLSFFSFFFFSGFFYIATSAQAKGEYISVISDNSNERELASSFLDKYITPKPTLTESPIFKTKAFEPILSPTITPVVIVVTNLEALFTKYCSEYGVDRELMKKIARCESGFNSRADTGIYGGMFQFLTSTWVSTRRSIGLDPDPELRFNAEESIKTAAYMLSKGRQNDWPVCSK